MIHADAAVDADLRSGGVAPMRRQRKSLPACSSNSLALRT